MEVARYCPTCDSSRCETPALEKVEGEEERAGEEGGEAGVCHLGESRRGARTVTCSEKEMLSSLRRGHAPATV